MLDRITNQHIKIVGIVFLMMLVVVGVYSGMSYMHEQKEKDLQTQYYSVQKTYLEKKTNFEKADNPEKPAATKDKKEVAPVAEAKATGNIDTDYGPEVKGYEDLLVKAPGSEASKLAAIDLTEIYMKYKSNDKAEAALKKLSLDKRDFLSALTLNLLAEVQSSHDCKSAIDNWNKVLVSPEMSFLTAQVKMDMALCYSQLGENDKANNLMKEVKTDAKNPALTKVAEKYSRLMKK